VLDGFRMIVDKVNEKGGVLGRKIEHPTRDEKFKPDIGLAMAKELVMRRRSISSQAPSTAAQPSRSPTLRGRRRSPSSAVLQRARRSPERPDTATSSAWLKTRE